MFILQNQSSYQAPFSIINTPAPFPLSIVSGGYRYRGLSTTFNALGQAVVTWNDVHPMFEGDLGSPILDNDNYEPLLAFFMACLGNKAVFRWRYPGDFDHTFDVPKGSGDFLIRTISKPVDWLATPSNRLHQIYREYIAGPYSYCKPITGIDTRKHPDTGVKVRDLITKAPINNFQLLDDVGQIVFVSEIVDTLEIDCWHFLAVRFEQAALRVTLENLIAPERGEKRYIVETPLVMGGGDTIAEQLGRVNIRKDFRNRRIESLRIYEVPIGPWAPFGECPLEIVEPPNFGNFVLPVQYEGDIRNFTTSVQPLTFDTIAGIAWTFNGNRCFVGERSNKRIFQYNAETNWQLKGLQYSGDFIDVGVNTTSNIVEIAMPIRERSIYVLTSNFNILKYELPNPGSLSGAIFAGSKTLPNVSANRGLWVKDDETQFWVPTASGTIQRFDTPVAGDISQIVAGPQSPSIGFSGSGLAVRGDGAFLYTILSPTAVREFEMSVAFDPSTVISTGKSIDLRRFAATGTDWSGVTIGGPQRLDLYLTGDDRTTNLYNSAIRLVTPEIGYINLPSLILDNNQLNTTDSSGSYVGTFFSLDGASIYHMDTAARDGLVQRSLLVDFDLASYQPINDFFILDFANFFLPDNRFRFVQGVAIEPGHQRFYFIGGGNPNTSDFPNYGIFQLTLTVPDSFELPVISGSFQPVPFVIPMLAMAMSDDERFIMILRSSQQWTLIEMTTPGDLSTAIVRYTVETTPGGSAGVAVSADGTRMWQLRTTTNQISLVEFQALYPYGLDPEDNTRNNWSYAGSTEGERQIPITNANPRGLQWNPDRTGFYISLNGGSGTNDAIVQVREP